ncbi:xanthine dehydrogenase small subunit [Oricola cellulosilytica]|uniref:Xanthine dehydrogenase small subunit n=1 Tax=Oricola cellulosilytica TaxID=1429082 RepID=A0A4R0P606_9HYPH|nr:xanthine dehydrogenase small subunit [Oricola cellulosilytica]TCD11296.1 xanthine dehydrogenase small subunit [Oricola cellulosilytica]
MNAETKAAEAIRFVLNGKTVEFAVRPDTTALDLVRLHAGLTGTKEGCAEGDCGACTVLLRRGDGPRQAANACIMTAAQLDGTELTTVEGLKHDGALTPLQDAMAQNGSSQCGFCTPGIVMALTGLIEENPEPEETAIHDALAGNLCRCTGYRPIVEATKVAAKAKPASIARSVLPPLRSEIAVGGCVLHQPGDLAGLLELRGRYPDAVLLAGGTDLGVARADYHSGWDRIVSTAHVRELRAITATRDEWTFGAAVTWEEVLATVADDYPSLATLIRRFGSTQIRSMGTIGGNIGTASPIGDGPPPLIALGATITLASRADGERSILLEDFFLDYRKTAMRPDEVIISVTLPRLKDGELFRVYKLSKRYDQDISTVCGAFWLRMEGDTVSECRIAYGGMAAIPKRAKSSENKIIGRPLDSESTRAAVEALSDDFSPLSDWRGSAEYRMKAAGALIQRLAHDAAGETVEVMAL